MPVFNSSAVKEAVYDAQTQRLTLWLGAERRKYDYCNVPQSVYDGLCRAASKGGYFNSRIDGRYHC